MAHKTKAAELVDQSLRYSHAMIDELVEVTREWDEIPDGERASWIADWDQFALWVVTEVTEDHVNCRMNPEQAAEYQRLLRRIDEHRDLIQRYGLTMPRVAVET